MIATAAVQHVPYPGIAQTRPGGRIIAPWTTTYYPSGLLCLTVHDDGTASGRIGTETSFMQLRGQRIPRFRASEIITDADREQASTSQTNIHAASVVNHHRHVETAIGLRVPRCQNIYVPHTERTGELWFVDQWSRSWAAAQPMGRRRLISTEELICGQGIKPIASVDELAQGDPFESDEEYLADPYAARRSGIA